ncbi:MAG TPA: rod-binding protein [Planctomycetota bacterium]|nr:rod-binding protein [Planctomycetota bacterium]
MEITSAAPAASTQTSGARRTPRDVALKFEALLVNQMFNAMQNTVEKSGLLDGGSAEDTYREMLNQALSDELGRRGGLGLAEHIQREIEFRVQSSKLRVQS